MQDPLYLSKRYRINTCMYHNTSSDDIGLTQLRIKDNIKF